MLLTYFLRTTMRLRGGRLSPLRGSPGMTNKVGMDKFVYAIAVDGDKSFGLHTNLPSIAFLPSLPRPKGFLAPAS
jgi:hypothetical protein